MTNDSTELTCTKCGGKENLSYVYIKRNQNLVCDKCRSKVTQKSQKGKFLPPDKKKVQWEQYAKEKNGSIARKYA